MGMYPIRIWFVCKLCKGSVEKVDTFIDHKKESHFDEFQKIKCIVFEEKSAEQVCCQEAPTSLLFFEDPYRNHCKDHVQTQNQSTPINTETTTLNPLNSRPHLQTPVSTSTFSSSNSSVRVPMNAVDPLNEEGIFSLEVIKDEPEFEFKDFKAVNVHIQEYQIPAPQHQLPANSTGTNENDPNDPCCFNSQRGTYIDLEIKSEFEDETEDDEGEISTSASNENSGCSLLSSSSKPVKINPGSNHLNKKTSTYICPLCSKEFMREYSLKFHIESHKSKEDQCRPFVCDFCGSAFRAKYHLKEHLITHSDDTPFKCPHPNCTEAFKRKTGLHLHQKTHSDFRPFKCPHPGCSKAFKAKRAVQLHLSCHTTERPFHCPEEDCNKTFKRCDHLCEHMRLKHSKPGEVPTFSCYVCNKSFQTKASLKKHSSVHEPDRPFKCRFHGCTADFKRKRNLDQHKRVHAK